MTTESRRRLGRIPDWALLTCFCLIVVIELLPPLLRQSATFDEPGNLLSGYLSLRFGNDRLFPQNLPLVKLLAAVPLVIDPDYALPPSPEPWSIDAQYRYASRFLYNMDHDGDALLVRGRLAVLPISLILGVGIFLWTKQLLGRNAAILALALFAFEPNVLAHSALITTDISAACFMFWTLFGWYQLMMAITWPRLVLTGMALGLAMISKFTALSLFPILFALGMFVALDSSHCLKIQLAGMAPRTVASIPRKSVVALALMAGMTIMAAVVIWAGYGFSYQSTVEPIPAYPMAWGKVFHASPIKPLLVLARDAALIPEAYLYGLAHQLKISGSVEAYLMGETRAGGWWYYFLVTLLLKTPIPLLLSFLVAVPLHWPYWRSHRPATVCLLVPTVLYLFLLSISGWNTGHRHLLPILPLLIILASGLTNWAIGRGKLMRFGLVTLLCWYVASSVLMHPHYLAYFNEVVGGPDNGHHYLIDSNLDWGQDLKGLKRYMEREGIDRIWLSYFGQAGPDFYKIDYDYLPSYFNVKLQDVDTSLFKIAVLPPLAGTVAISATLLQGGALQSAYGIDPRYFEVYRRQTPVAKIGYSIFIYRLQ